MVGEKASLFLVLSSLGTRPGLCHPHGEHHPPGHGMQPHDSVMAASSPTFSSLPQAKLFGTHAHNLRLDPISWLDPALPSIAMTEAARSKLKELGRI